MFLCNDIVLFQEIYLNLSQKALNLLLLAVEKAFS